jgi:FkbM family methyltransferase
LIIDCGANVGLAIRYWLKRHPHARILAFEPDPDLFVLLKRNCASFPPKQVILRNAAVSGQEGVVEFSSTGVETGHLDHVASQPVSRPILVKAVRLSRFLDQGVDFLKVDIEGAEVDVLTECAERLQNVKQICVEFHSIIGREQSLDRLLAALSAAGFRYHIVPEAFSERPLYEIGAQFGMDGRLIIWAFRGPSFPRIIDATPSWATAHPPVLPP